MHSDFPVHHLWLCILLHVENSWCYGSYPLWSGGLVNYHYVYIRTLLTPLDKHSPSTVIREGYALHAVDESREVEASDQPERSHL